MNGSHDNERLFIAKCALVLFVSGLLAPFLIAALVLACSGSRSEDAAVALAVGFGFACEVLALILGIVGRRHTSGKIGILGGVIMFVAVVATVLAGALWKAKAKNEMERQIDEKVRAEQDRFRADFVREFHEGKRSPEAPPRKN